MEDFVGSLIVVLVIGFIGLVVYCTIKEEQENPCVEYETSTYYTYSKLTNTIIPHKRQICVQRQND